MILTKTVYITLRLSAFLCNAYEKLTKKKPDICHSFHLKDSGARAIIILAMCLHFVLSLFMSFMKAYYENFASNGEDSE